MRDKTTSKPMRALESYSVLSGGVKTAEGWLGEFPGGPGQLSKWRVVDIKGRIVPGAAINLKVGDTLRFGDRPSVFIAPARDA